MTLADGIELTGVACNLVLTALTLLRACQGRHYLRALMKHFNLEDNPYSFRRSKSPTTNRPRPAAGD
jgi:hypothetical protein